MYIGHVCRISRIYVQTTRTQFPMIFMGTQTKYDKRPQTFTLGTPWPACSNFFELEFKPPSLIYLWRHIPKMTKGPKHSVLAPLLSRPRPPFVGTVPFFTQILVHNIFGFSFLNDFVSNLCYCISLLFDTDNNEMYQIRSQIWSRLHNSHGSGLQLKE